MYSVPSIAVFGDPVGLPRLLRVLPAGSVNALIRASIRPEQSSVLEKLADSAGIPLLVQPSERSAGYPEFLHRMKEEPADLFLVDSYSLRLPQELLDIPLRGAVNVHGALLPQYRGANPTQWALINDERETGVTIHQMTDTIDAGDIIAQERVPIRIDNTWVEIQERLATLTEQMLNNLLPDLLAGSIAALPQDDASAAHFHRRYRDDGLIDFIDPIIAIHNLIRALVRPHPGAILRDQDGAETIIDEYRTISQVACLKYANIQQPLLPEDFVAVPAEAGANSSVEFTIPSNPAQRAAIRQIDWESRTASITAPPGSPRAREVLAEFASLELGLRIRK